MKKKVLLGLVIIICCMTTACGKKEQQGETIETSETMQEVVSEGVDITKWIDEGKKLEKKGDLKGAWVQFLVAAYYDPKDIEPKLFYDRNVDAINGFKGEGIEAENECMDEIFELFQKADMEAYQDYYKKWIPYVQKRNKRVDIAVAECYASGYKLDINAGYITEDVTERTKITEENIPQNYPFYQKVLGMNEAYFYYTLDVENNEVVIYINDLDVYPNYNNADWYIGE